MPDTLAHGVDFGGFERYLVAQEKAPATIEKYLRDVRAFRTWLERTSSKTDETDGIERAQETIARWKAYLADAGFAATSINGKLAAPNSYFSFIGRPDLHARYLKVQRRIFRDSARELTRRDYERLIHQAKKERRETIALVMETICATGIRVSELQFLTIEALHAGRIDVSLKGKSRTVFIPRKLKGKLLDYARRHAISRGTLFLNKRGGRLTRYSIWAQMKALCRKAKIQATKVFPHNLRHLFARAFYEATKDIVKLADVLGHSSIETTRIYLMTPGEEYGRLIDRLGLVV